MDFYAFLDQVATLLRDRCRVAYRALKLQAHSHLGLGTLYTRGNRWEQAHTALSAAIELYRAMDMTFRLPQAEAAIAIQRLHRFVL